MSFGSISSRSALAGALAAGLSIAAILQRQRGGLELGFLAVFGLLAVVLLREAAVIAGRVARPSPVALLCAGAAVLGVLLAYPAPRWAVATAALASALVVVERCGPAAAGGPEQAVRGIGAVAVGVLLVWAGRVHLLAPLVVAAAASQVGARATDLQGVAAAGLRVGPALIGAALFASGRAGPVAGLLLVLTATLAARGLGPGRTGVALLLGAGAAASGALLEAPRTGVVLAATAVLPWLGQRVAPRVRVVGFMVALGLAAVLVVAHARGQVASVGGIDAFFYLCFARDALAGQGQDIRFIYFPGVYHFWSAAMALVGDVLPRLQAIYLLLLASVAALTGLVVARATGARWLALAAALWTVRLMGRYEGLEACTEPLVAAPALVGLAAWGGGSLAGRRGLARALALGVGLGLAVYAKQQGVLIAAAAVVLVPLAWRGAADHKPGWGPALAIAAAAGASFFVGVLVEGRGLEPIGLAVHHARVYAAHGSMVDHLGVAAAAEVPYGLAVLLTLLLACGWWLGLARRIGRPGDRALPVLALCATAAMLAQVQLVKRSYLHYQLLAIPFVAASVAIGAAVLLRTLPRRRVTRWAAATVFVLASIRVDLHDSAFGLWPARAAAPPRPLWGDQPQVRADLVVLEREVRRGERLLILPPGWNGIHFQLGTRADYWIWGYCWSNDFPLSFRDVQWTDVACVLVMREGEAQEVWGAFGCGEVVAALPGLGFAPTLDLPTFTLWRRQ